MPSQLLKICNLDYSYDNDRKALSNINIELYENEKIAVLGSNGAGKSTFFLIMNGVLMHDRGSIYYKGREITKKDLNILRRNIGIVFQDADNQIIASTVLAEVSFGPMNLKLSKPEVEKRVQKALDYMNINQFRNRPPHYLSGGEKKRVSIADIIAMESEVIIFDEPTASLDPFNADMLEEILNKLLKEKKTILLSTHDVNFAFRWAERIIIFHEGNIIADNKPIDIFCNDKILNTAHLNRPILLDIYEILLKKGIVNKKDIYPKTIKEFNDIILSTKSC